MKRAFGLLAIAIAASCAYAQTPASVQAAADDPAAHGPVGNLPGWGTAPPARNISLPEDGHCQAVRYGDIVHYSLRIDHIDEARRVYTSIELAMGKHAKYKTVGLRLPERNTLGGGSPGARDGGDAKMYHFSFVVPDVDSGIYRTSGIDVRATYTRNSADPGVSVPLNRHATNQVRNYCLAVFGGGGGDHRAVVTDFLRNPVEHPTTPPEEPIFH